jgi:hypothetical protein
MPRVREEPNLFEALSSMRIFIEDASPTELTPWQLEDQIDTFHRIERDWKRQGQPFAHIERLVHSGNVTNTSLETAVFVDRVLERLES